MGKILLFILLCSNLVLAQDTAKFISTFQLAGMISGGNSERVTLSTSETFSYTKGKISIYTNPSFIYGTSNKIVKETEYFQTISAQKKFSKRSKIMIFSDIEHSNLRYIDSRLNFGEGYLYRIISNDSISLDLSEALLMEKTQVKNYSLYDIFACRLSTRIRFNCKIGKTKISVVSLIQPSIAQFSPNIIEKVKLKDNFLSRTTIHAEWTLVKKLSFISTFSYIVETYSNYLTSKGISARPKSVDYNLQFGIKYTQ